MPDDCKKEEIIADIKAQVNNLNDMKAVVIELKTLVTMLCEQTKKQDEIIKQQSETLIKINDTVTQQGILLTQLAAQTNELQVEGTIKYTQIFQILITKAIPPILLAGITYWILQIVAQ